MATYKYIYWRDDLDTNDKGEVFAHVHLLVGYNQATISDYQDMVDELRQTFPQATDKEICGGKVIHSSYVKGFTIITWSGYIPKGEYPDWTQFDNGRMEYYW